MADSSSSSPGSNVLERVKTYCRTLKGTLLSAEIVLSLVILICYASSYSGGYTVVAIIEMVMALIFFIVYMMELDKQFTAISWGWSDLFRSAVGAVIYLITSLICVIRGAGDGALIAGGVFGLLAGLVFAYDAFITYKHIQSTRTHSAAPTVDSV